MAEKMKFARWSNDLYTGRRSYPIVQRRRTWFSVAGAFAVAAILILSTKGLVLGIDFRGGTEFTVEGVSSTEQSLGVDAVQSVIPLEEPRVAIVGSNSVRVQTTHLEDSDRLAVEQTLADGYGVDEGQVTSSFIGPTWGQGVSVRALWGVVVFVLATWLFMWIYFRSWRMALAGVVAMMSDLLVAAGLYALVGWEVTASTVIGFLTILGFSLYDKMIVFDKVRENTLQVLDQSRNTYAERANLAVNQTLVRSINTSVVSLLPVSGILFVGAMLLGAGTLRDLSLSLFIGLAVGALSSIFLGPPLDVALREREPRYREHTDRVLAERGALAETEGKEAELAAAAAGRAQLIPGQHRGNAAQPRRKRAR
ncbi:protein translocase subunit SecF [Isoptericola croceus]|uniref:protein translocase subunit SecF n=1 Tax=Isoptericola croceus TaxID=3031406 RepID=UPI0023F8827E|nr:protein translocase subunit SecF [Isoptericola croceus]